MRLWETIETYRVTSFIVVATVYAALLNVPLAGRDISSLRLAASGAAPLPVEIIDRFKKTFGIAILEGYGLTEGCCMSARNPQNGVRKVGSIGFRIPYQPMKSVVLDSNGAYVRDCAVDEVGVLALKGPNAIDSYLHGRDGLFVDDDWINTGDLGRQDADGYFFITGRAKDLIIRSGHNIDPRLIEHVLQSHPDVDLAAAVGMPDTYAGELPVALSRAGCGSIPSSGSQNAPLRQRRSSSCPPCRSRRSGSYRSCTFAASPPSTRSESPCANACQRVS